MIEQMFTMTCSVVYVLLLLNRQTQSLSYGLQGLMSSLARVTFIFLADILALMSVMHFGSLSVFEWFLNVGTRCFFIFNYSFLLLSFRVGFRKG